MLATALLATGALLAGKPARCASAGRRMATSAPQMSSAYGFSARDLATGSVTELSDYEGQVSLIVNVASK
jgi:hypothetical protein